MDVIKQHNSDMKATSSSPKNYSQTALFRSLKRFMVLQNAEPEAYKHFAGVFCSGLSICFSTFYLMNKHVWWTNLLKAIIESIHKFDQQGYLDEPAIDWQLPQQTTVETHRQLIERVIHYVTFTNARPDKLAYHQAMWLGNNNYNQSNILHSIAPHSTEGHIQHEYLTNASIQKMQSTNTISGLFTHELLLTAIDEDDLDENIFKIVSETHEYALVYKKSTKRYGFYDPDSIKGGAEWFSDKSTLVAHILNSLQTNYLVLECASTQPAQHFFKSFRTQTDFKAIYPLHTLPFVFLRTACKAQWILGRYLEEQQDVWLELVIILLEKYAIESPNQNHISYTLEKVFAYLASKEIMINQLFDNKDTILSNGKTLIYNLALNIPIKLKKVIKEQVTPPRNHECFFFNNMSVTDSNAIKAAELEAERAVTLDAMKATELATKRGENHEQPKYRMG